LKINLFRRTSSGYYSSASENGGSNSSRRPEDIKDSSRFLEDSKKNKPDLKNVKPKVDTGLGIKKSASQTRIPENPVPPPLQKRSEPNLSKHRKFSGSFKVPDLPPTSTFTRNTGNRRSLTRLFLRNGDNRKVDKGSGGEIKTPFGVCKETPEPEEVNCKRSNFLNKRSITSLSLFNRKEDEPSSGQDNKVIKYISRINIKQGYSCNACMYRASHIILDYLENTRKTYHFPQENSYISLMLFFKMIHSNEIF
jgi:hypothetical protein